MKISHALGPNAGRWILDQSFQLCCDRSQEVNQVGSRLLGCLHDCRCGHRNELSAEIGFEVLWQGHGSAYEKMKRKVGDYATAAAAVILVMDGGTCRDARIALTNLADVPLLARAAGQALIGTPVDSAAILKAAAAAVAITAPASDLRGPAEFRKHVAGIMVRRAIERASERAGG